MIGLSSSNICNLNLTILISNNIYRVYIYIYMYAFIMAILDGKIE